MGDNSALLWQPLPDVPFCAERQRLREAFCEAQEQLTMIQDQHVATVVSGDDDFAGFDVLIQIAQEKENQAKAAYICHVEQHGC